LSASLTHDQAIVAALEPPVKAKEKKRRGGCLIL
jgi:hypothetical protein